MTAIPRPARARAGSSPLTFTAPDWLGVALRVVLIRGVPWFVGGDLLTLPAFGKPDQARGPIYSRMPKEHRRGVSRRRYGLTGQGPAEAVVISLAGLRRLLKLQRAAERRAGLSGPANDFEVVLVDTILPAIEGAMEAWERTAPGVDASPAEVESVADRLARLDAISREVLNVAAYCKQRRFITNNNQRKELGVWAAGYCRAHEIDFEVSKGVGYYQRRVLDLGAKWLGLD